MESDLSHFDKFPIDIQRKILLELSPMDLINFCRTNKENLEKFCQDKVFWRLKLEHDFPDDFLSYQKKKLVLKNPKNTYIKLFTEETRNIEKEVLSLVRAKKYLLPYQEDIILGIIKTLEQLKKIPNYPIIFTRRLNEDALVVQYTRKNLSNRKIDNNAINDIVDIILRLVNRYDRKLVNLGILSPQRHINDFIKNYL
jgi:hypothetical protein